eukprot:1838034-Prymnesium_polylepis.1
MGSLWATRREAGSGRRVRRADPASGPPRGVRGGPTREWTGPSGPGLASWVCLAAPGAVWASGMVVMRRLPDMGAMSSAPGCARGLKK